MNIQFGVLITLTFVLTITGSVFAQDRIPHNSVSPFSESAGQAQLEVAPYLVVRRGCQPYAGVDSVGNYSGGLRSTGRVDGDCTDTIYGNTYARSQCVSTDSGWEYCGHMFGFYFPKDVSRTFFRIGGHRHDWEEGVVFTQRHTDGRFDIVGVAASDHGDYKYYISPSLVEGTHPVLIYGYFDNIFRGATHSMEVGQPQDGGRQFPVIGWDQLTPAARQTLNRTDIWKNNPSDDRSSAVVPFRDDNFRDKLNEANQVNGNTRFVPVNF